PLNGITRGTNKLTIMPYAALIRTVAGVGNLSVSGTTADNMASITTTGTQTYSGATTLGQATTLAGTTVTLTGVTGAGNNLTVTGNAVLNTANAGGGGNLGGSATTADNASYLPTPSKHNYSRAPAAETA